MIVDVVSDGGPTATVTVALDGGDRLLASVTRQSADRLNLVPGRAVDALIKSVALDERVPRLTGQNRFLRARTSASTSSGAAPARPTAAAITGSSARRNGFVAFSRPMKVRERNRPAP